MKRNSESKQTILVTGFGPFDKHVVNASWEAVKELNDLWITTEESCDIQLIIKEIPVSYVHVSINILELWKVYKPFIVVHVGVSHKAECLTIEDRAHSTGYCRKDVCDTCPNESKVKPEIYQTDVDVNAVCEMVNKNCDTTGCKACISKDAGRYLCEYIFFQSLRIQAKRTLFVHVPDFDTYSPKQTAKGLQDVIRSLIKLYKSDR